MNAPRRQPLPVDLLLLVAVGMLVFANALPGGYSLDDPRVILECEAIDSPAGLARLWGAGYGPAFGELSYRPLVSLSYFLDAALGREPLFSRAINLALHLLTGGLLYGLWRRLGARPHLALATAAFFLVHPLATSTVNSPGFREEILMTAAVAGALLCSALCLEGWRPVLAGAGAGACLLAGLLAKETALLAPLLALVLFWERDYPQGAKRRAGVLALAGVLAVALWLPAYLAWSVNSGLAASAGWPGGGGPLLAFLNFCRAFLLYARLWLWPQGLSVGHEFEAVGDYGAPGLWLGLAVLAGLVVLGFWLRLAPGRRAEARLAGAGLLWALLALAPVSQLLPTPQLVAERYCYLSLAGLGLMLAALLARLEPPRQRRNAAVLVLLVWSALSVARNFDWRDELTLNISRYERWQSAEGRAALSALHYAKGDSEASEAAARQALERDPDQPTAHRVLGVLAMGQGRLDEAAGHLRRAADLEPQNPLNHRALEVLEQLRRQATPAPEND